MSLLPSFRLAGERVEQRSAFGVSRLLAMHLRQCRTYTLLTRSLLRSTTFSIAARQRGN